MWSLQQRRARAEAHLAILWRCFRIGLTTGRLARSPDSRSLLRTVWRENRTFARPGVLRAVSSTVIIRFWRWIRRKCLSSRCDVTRDLPLHGLSFVLSVCRRRIISLEIVILDTFKWSARPDESFQSEPCPPLAHGHFDGAVASTFFWKFQNGELFTFVDITIKYRRWLKCLIWSSQSRSWDGKLTFLNLSVTEQDVIVCFVRINAFQTNIDVNDNKQLFWS